MKKGLISIIIPNKEGEENETLKTLENQTYKNFEVIEVIDKKGEGAGATRNKGLKKVKGEFILFLDNDINLRDYCLETFVKTLEKNPDCDWAFCNFIFGKIETNRGRKAPDITKKDVELIREMYKISANSFFRASCKPKFDVFFKRYNDWDLFIRMAKNGHKGAFCGDEVLFDTPYGKEGRISGGGTSDRLSWQRIIYKTHSKKIADIVIPHHDQHKLLAKCLSGIDNKLFYIHIESGGTFAENCNRGAKNAITDNIIFLNDDVEPIKDILVGMVDDKNDITGVAQLMMDRNKIIYGMTFDPKGAYGGGHLAEKSEDAIIPSGFCFKVTKKAWEKLGGLDESFINGGEDNDFGLRALEMGISIGFIENYMKHHHSQSEGRNDFDNVNLKRLKEKWFYSSRASKIKIPKIKKAKSVFQKESFIAKKQFKLKGEIINKGEMFSCESDKKDLLIKQGLI